MESATAAAAPDGLSRGETTFWYGFAAVSYVGASLVEKGLLNWFVGPVWLVAVVWLGPLAHQRLRGRRDGSGGRDGSRAGGGTAG